MNFDFPCLTGLGLPNSVPNTHDSIESTNNLDFNTAESVLLALLDTEFVVGFFLDSLTRSNGRAGTSMAVSMLTAAYGQFTLDVLAAFRSVHATQHGVVTHTFDAGLIGRQLEDTSAAQHVVSLHPLASPPFQRLRVSRLYEAGGTLLRGMVERPGSPSLENQLSTLKHRVGDDPIVLLEDDCFSGKTLSRTVELCHEADIAISEIKVGVSVGRRPPLRLLGYDVPFSSLVHVSQEGTGKVELIDIRDFLIGASGLVVQLPGGALGRVPYFSPFVSASARASIPKDAEHLFSALVLKANHSFFSTLDAAGISLRLTHADPAFRTALHALVGRDDDRALSRVVNELRELVVDDVPVSEHKDVA